MRETKDLDFADQNETNVKDFSNLLLLVVLCDYGKCRVHLCCGSQWEQKWEVFKMGMNVPFMKEVGSGTPVQCSS